MRGSDWIARVEAALSRLRRGAVAHRAHRRARPSRSVAPGAERDEEFFRVNALLLRNPSVVNMLDGCAISIPCHAPGELPVGLMIWQVRCATTPY